MEEVKINLVAVRANARMNQREWAEALGVSPTTVNNWENGHQEPPLSTIREMSNLSGIPIRFIFFD